MGRMYSAQFNGVSVSAQQDLFEVNAPSSAAVIIHGFEIGQITDTGDVDEEMLLIRFRRGNTTSGSGGTTPTAVQLGASAAFGGTVEANNTTKATAGSPVTPHVGVWNIRTPYLYLPTPEQRITVAPGARFAVELATTPGSTIVCAGVITFEAVS